MCTEATTTWRLQPDTMANLHGFVSKRGGEVILAVTLTGKPHSVKLAPVPGRISTLRRKHGTKLENWRQEEFGFDFGLLSAFEARYLELAADADTIRNRVLKAKQEGTLNSGQGRTE